MSNSNENLTGIKLVSNGTIEGTYLSDLNNNPIENVIIRDFSILPTENGPAEVNLRFEFIPVELNQIFLPMIRTQQVIEQNSWVARTEDDPSSDSTVTTVEHLENCSPSCDPGDCGCSTT